MKFLPDEFVDDPVAMRRFEREARAASSLNHPNICTIHAIDEQDGKHFIVMELLDGETLRVWITENHATEPRPKPFPVAECVQLAVQIANGLSAAHEKGLIHRDIKPANIVLTREGRIKILDFGLAKIHDMSPEQIRGERLDARTDIFSFGLVLYGRRVPLMPSPDHGHKSGTATLRRCGEPTL